MINVKLDPRLRMRDMDERLKALPDLDAILKKISDVDAVVSSGVDDNGDNGHFHLPYSSDPPLVGDPWK